MSKVIACIDGSPVATAVCDAAAWISQQLDAPLDLLHVLDKAEYPTELKNKGDLSGNIGLGSREHLLADLVELDAKRGRLALEHGKDMLNDAKQRAEAKGAVNVTTHQRHGSLMETLQEMESETRVLVMGRQGEAHADQAHSLGSHLENVVRALHKPIMVALPDFEPPKNFMIAYDGSATATKALEEVAESDLLKGLPCHLVMVAEDDKSHQAQLNTATERLTAAGFDVTARLLQGSVHKTLKTYHQNNNIDLKVMGAYGHSRIRRFLVGSNTSKMVRMSDTSLLLLR